MMSLPPNSKRGTLYVVSTPIGNREDITLRALRILKEMDLIAAEDTRHTGSLLRHFGIQTPLTSYFEGNEKKKKEFILSRLKQGDRVALVSDAGTPGISHPRRSAAGRAEAVLHSCGLCFESFAFDVGGAVGAAWT